MFRHTAIYALIICTLPCFAQQKAILADVAQRAAATTTLTAPGGSAFHLRAVIRETTNPDSGYKGEIEEYWVAPDKWKRTVTTPDFSQTVVVNGGKYYEQNRGAYYQQWLRELVTAMFEPLPMLEQLRQTKAEIAVPSGAPHSTSCSRFESTVGTAPTQNSVFSVFCFTGNPVVVESVVTPGYAVEFRDYKSFGAKQIARRLVSDPEPGTNLEVKVTELSPLSNPEESLFSVPESTPVSDRIQTVRIPESTARTLSVDTPPMQWPSIRAGKTSGVLSLYVCVDRNGQVREVWPLNSDNPGLDDAARAQVMKWRFKSASVKGAPVQFESVFTFGFDAKVENPIRVLTNEEARRLATHVVEPTFKPGAAPKGTEFTIRVSIGADGKVLGAQNRNKIDTALFLAGMGAVEEWKFKPYLRDGKPDAFDADITFRVK